MTEKLKLYVARAHGGNWWWEIDPPGRPRPRSEPVNGMPIDGSTGPHATQQEALVHGLAALDGHALVLA
jgi:hypothetical protein